MAEFQNQETADTLTAMKTIIDRLETLLAELQALSGGAPVIEKNVEAMKSFLAVLQYGISDVAEEAEPE